jgi:hypothetical protein
LACGGIAFGAVANGKDSEHKILANREEILSQGIDNLSEANQRQDETISQLRVDMATVKEQTKTILDIVKLLRGKVN